MTAQIIPLITSQSALWALWVEARQRLYDNPTTENAAACCTAFKAYYIRVDCLANLPPALAAERRACAQILETRGHLAHGQQ